MPITFSVGIQNLFQENQELKKQKYTCYIDLEGSQTSAGGTIPPNLVVTTLKPDVVIIDKSNKTATIFELTIPSEHRIKTAHELKFQKY